MVSQLVLLSDSFPSDSELISTRLDTTVHVVVDGEETDIDSVIFIPKLKAKELAKYLTVNLNSGEKSIDFTGLLMAIDTSIDSTTLTVLERLSKVNLRVSSGYEPVEGSALDLQDGVFSADIDELTHWLETKSIRVSAGSEEEVVDQLDDLLADLDFDEDETTQSDVQSDDDFVGGTDQRNDASETLVMPVVDVEREQEERDAEQQRKREQEEARLREEQEQERIAEQARIERERQEQEEKKKEAERQRAEQERKEQEALERKREQEKQQREREEQARLAEQERKRQEEDDVEEDELFDPMADEMEPISFTQDDLFNSTDDEQVNTDAYIDSELDNEEHDYGTQNARASEPTMTGNIDSPAFLKRKEKEREEARRIAEQLVPDPEKFDSDDLELTVEDLEQNDGGFPKGEALSETPGTSKPMRNESAGEGSPHNDLNLDDDEHAKSSTAHSEVLGLSDDDDDDGRERIGFSAPSLTPRDSFDALKSRRHRETRVGGLTGPSGGSGKTTTAYCLFLGSSVVDNSFSKQRSNQWTWLIEMDYQNPKWKHRTSIPAEKSMVQLVHEFNRRKGTITDDELIDLAKRHSVQILGSTYERSRLIAAPELNDYTHSNITRREFMIVANRLINALSRNTAEPSTIIMDLPDYSGENLDQNLSDIVNRYCDNVAVCFPEDGDIADLHSIIELLRNQRQHKVSTQRISVIGTRMRTDQEEELSKACRDMHINFAGRIPLFPSIRRQSEDSESVAERKTWIGNADERTKKNAAMAGTRILQETLLNPMAKMYLREMRKRLQQKNPARKDNENRTKRGSSGKSTKAKKKKSGFKSLFGLS